MAKPTLLQSLLNRPSQSYAHYAEKDYHSAKQDFARAAASASSSTRPNSRASTSSEPTQERARPSQYQSTRRSLDSTRAELIVPSTSRPRPQFQVEAHHRCNKQNDLISNSYLPSDSHPPQTPLLSLSSEPLPPPHSELTARALPSLPDPHLLHPQLNHTHPDCHHVRSPSAAAREHPWQDKHEDQEIDEDDTLSDVFYTPLTSPVVSMVIDPASISSLLPSPISSPRAVLVQRESTSSTSSNDSEDGSISTTPTSDDSLSAAKGKLEHKKVPVDDIDGVSPELIELNIAVKPRSQPDLVNDKPSSLTIPVSSNTAPRSAVHSSSMISTAVSRISQSDQRSHRRFSSVPTPPPVRLKYTDEDWAKEVRWLDPSTTASSSLKPSKPANKHKHKPLVHDSEYADLPVPPRRPRAGRSRTTSARPRSKVQMTALWEEDEEGTTISDHHQHPPSGHGHTQALSDSLILTSELRARSRTISESSISPSLSRSNSLKSATSPRTSSTPPSHSATLSVRTLASTATSTSTRSPYTMSSRTVTLPTPLPVPAPASTTSGLRNDDSALADLGATAAPSMSGYTTMTLPRAAYKPADPWRTIGGGKVDLAREGKAQTTMASIEVVRGVAESLPGGKGGLLKRSGSSAKRSSWLFAGNGSSSKVDLTNAGSGSGSLSDALALTSHLSPPSHCPSSHVLVQVHAVALEGLDKELVVDKVKRSSGAGFIPGRSVAGRVVEVGWEVKEEIARRGDWVVGIVDPKKCGALAEFVILERHRLHRAPQPYLPTPQLFPSRQSHHKLPSRPSGPSLQSLALLPLIGVPAYRALRTYLAAVERGGIKGEAPSYPSSTTRGVGGRALILRGQDGVGGMAAQLLIDKGTEVWVQVEASIVGVEDSDGEEGESNVLVFESGDALEWEDADGNVRSGREGEGALEEVCERLRAWGVTGICVGRAVDVINVLKERLDIAEAEMEAGLIGDSDEALRSGGFDFILDTVGGREIWEAGQALLSRPQPAQTASQPRTPSSPRSPISELSPSDPNSAGWMDAQFTTVVGDKGSGKALPSTQDHWRAGVRSLKRAMVPSSSSPLSTTPIALSPTSPLSRSGSSTPISPGSRSARSSSEVVVRESLESSMLGVSESHGIQPRKLSSSGSEKDRKKLAKKPRLKVRKPRKVGYTWVPSVADVDFEGTDVRDALGALVGMLDGQGMGGGRRLRPEGCIEGEVYGLGRVVPFERTPEVFAGEGRKRKSSGLLEGGGTVVVKVVG